MIIVGLTGKAGSGKDTVADRLVDRHGFTKMSFAGPLKDVLRSIDPILGMDVMRPGQLITVTQALEACGGEEGVKKVYPAYRKYLQKLGTEGIRKYDEDFWINCALTELSKLDRNARVVFTDCRFPNEADVFHYALPRDTAELWMVDRPEELRGNGQVSAHSSEAFVGFMDEDITVHNNGSISDLYWIVDSLARDLIDVESVKLAA